MQFDVTLCVRSSSEHLAQLYTGFGLLAHAQKIKLTWRRDPQISANPYKNPTLHADIRGIGRIAYDVWDAPELHPELDARRADLIFKRT